MLGCETEPMFSAVPRHVCVGGGSVRRTDAEGEGGGQQCTSQATAPATYVSLAWGRRRVALGRQPLCQRLQASSLRQWRSGQAQCRRQQRYRRLLGRVHRHPARQRGHQETHKTLGTRVNGSIVEKRLLCVEHRVSTAPLTSMPANTELALLAKDAALSLSFSTRRCSGTRLRGVLKLPLFTKPRPRLVGLPTPLAELRLEPMLLLLSWRRKVGRGEAVAEAAEVGDLAPSTPRFTASARCLRSSATAAWRALWAAALKLAEEEPWDMISRWESKWASARACRGSHSHRCESRLAVGARLPPTTRACPLAKIPAAQWHYSTYWHPLQHQLQRQCQRQLWQ